MVFVRQAMYVSEPQTLWKPNTELHDLILADVCVPVNPPILLWKVRPPPPPIILLMSQASQISP